MRHWVGAPIPPALAHEAIALVAAMRDGSLPHSETERVIKVVVRMTGASLEYYFVRPVDVLGLGMTARKVANFGTSSMVKTLNFGLGKMLHRVSHKQWLQIADLIDEALIEGAATPEQSRQGLARRD